MQTMNDRYPSRVEEPGGMLPRRDPVVYASGAGAGPLDGAQLAAYDESGFLFLENFFSDEEVGALREEMERLRTSEQVRQSELSITEPTSGEIRSVFAVHTLSDLFRKLTCEARLVAIIEQILGSRVYIHQARVNFKPGFRGKEFYWHSDFETWHAEDGMSAMRAISCSVALTDNFEFNGPLMVIPGSHKHFCQCTGRTPDNHFQFSLKKQDYGIPSDEQLTRLVAEGGIAVPKGTAGSVILFECNLMHGSNGNITPLPRSNVFFVYNSMENALGTPFAAERERPWFLADRKPTPLEPIDFRAVVAEPAMQQS